MMKKTGAAIHKTGLIKSGNNWFYLDETVEKSKGYERLMVRSIISLMDQNQDMGIIMIKSVAY